MALSHTGARPKIPDDLHCKEITVIDVISSFVLKYSRQKSRAAALRRIFLIINSFPTPCRVFFRLSERFRIAPRLRLRPTSDIADMPIAPRRAVARSIALAVGRPQRPLRSLASRSRLSGFSVSLPTPVEPQRAVRGGIKRNRGVCQRSTLPRCIFALPGAGPLTAPPGTGRARRAHPYLLVLVLVVRLYHTDSLSCSWRRVAPRACSA